MTRLLLALIVVVASCWPMAGAVAARGQTPPTTRDNEWSADPYEASLLGEADADVAGILSRWRDQIAPQVPAAERKKVEDFVAKYPVEAPPGAEPIDFQVKQGKEWQVTPVVNRKDWAYAIQGASYTLGGIVGQGQKAMLDVGFWCFLEAALLRPDEVEHLSNVAFHLNLRMAYDDAATVLLHAREMDDSHVAVRNNLAYSYAGRGDFNAALAEQEQAIMLRPDQLIYQERLARYLAAAGQPLAATSIIGSLMAWDQKVRDVGVPSFTIPPPLSPGGKQALDNIDALSAEFEDWAVDRLGPAREEAGRAVQAWTEAAGPILQRWGDCMWQVGQAPGMSGPEKLYKMCRDCDMPAAQQIMQATQPVFAGAEPLVEAFEAEALTQLAFTVSSAQSTVNSSTLDPVEAEYLLSQVHERIYVPHLTKILGVRQQMEGARKRTLAEFQSSMAAGCGAAPVELQYVEPWKPMDPLPALYVDLFFFSFQTQPDGTMKLSIGKGVQLKLEFNIETYQVGIGAGVGFSFGASVPGADLKLAKAEMSFVYRPGHEDPDKVIEADAGLKLKTLPGMVVPDQPKISIKQLAFEN